MNFCNIDIETTSLKSDRGYMLGCAFKPLGKAPYWIGLDDHLLYSGPIQPDDVERIDRYLALRVREEMEKYDGWITWNGIMFDVPFIDDRCLLSGRKGEDRDPHEKRWHIDVMYYTRQGKSCMTSSRLKWVEDVLGVKYRKTDLEFSKWKKAGQEMALGKPGINYSYIKKHGIRDVRVLEEVYELLKNRVQQIAKR